jgi:hypothetical protein
MLHSFGNESAFYELAATLIPLFLLGGVVFERLKPRKSDGEKRTLWMAAAIPTIGLWVILSEVVAIQALVTGNSTLITRLVVSSTLSAGMFAVLLSLWTPWLQQYKKMEPRLFLVSGSLARYWMAGFAAVFLVTVYGMQAAVSTQQTEEDAKETIVEINRVDDELVAVEDRIASLSVERAKTQREFSLAMKPGVGCLDVRAFLVEEDRLSQLLRRQLRRFTNLVIEGSNLQRKLGGSSPTNRSPFPPIPKFKPLAQSIPLKLCMKQIVSARPDAR